MSFTAGEIAKKVNGEVIGNKAITITGFSKADLASCGDLTFAENEYFFSLADKSQASAILAQSGFHSNNKTVIQVKDARIAFARVLPLFFNEKPFTPGIHPSAIIADSAEISDSAFVGANCIIDEGSKIGNKSFIQANCNIGKNTIVGNEVRLFPNVSIYSACHIHNNVRIHSGIVIGSDGFGYVFDKDHHRKILQIGGVIIEDDVEIGANCTIDRGALEDTVIGRGSKIDNLVQIGHNVIIGEHCIIVAQNAIGGSSHIGSFSVLAGQVGVAGHLKIGPKSIVAAKSGVITDLEGNNQYMGFPAVPSQEAKRQIVATKNLPKLGKRVTKIENAIRKLDGFL